MIDVLCRDPKGNLVVVETKKGSDGDKVFGQISRYIGYLQTTQERKVRGIVVVGEPDEKLDYALASSRNIKVKYYRIKFLFSDNPEITE